MRKLILTALVLLGLTAFTVVGAQHDQAEAQPGMDHMRMMMMDCPMAIADANVAVADTPNGIALTLTPKDPAKLDEFRALVRARVERMKTMREEIQKHR